MKKLSQLTSSSSVPVSQRALIDRRIFSSLIFTVLLPAPCKLFAREPAEDLEAGLERLRKRDKLPGLIAGHFTLSGEEELGVAGFRRAGTDQRLSIEDRMHLGSCTKSMTATLLGILVDEGKIGFETTLGEVFHDDPKVTGSSWKDATMRQLMSHTSGAIPNPPWNQFAGPIEDAVSIRRSLLHWMVERPLREKSVGQFEYSNLGYAILGHAIERIRGHAWEEEIRQRLFDPLGMKSAGFGPPSKFVADAPWGHNMAFGFSVSTDADNPPALGPAGTVHASMQDWIKYLRVHLMSDPAKECGLPLTAKTLEELHRRTEGTDYAGGWACGERTWAAGRILTHNGSNTRWYCVVFLALEQGRGVIAASNIGLTSAQACDEALQLMIRRHPKK
jgi:CubicO group peptidase (beta-lactamase class C family)